MYHNLFNLSSVMDIGDCFQSFATVNCASVDRHVLIPFAVLPVVSLG